MSDFRPDIIYRLRHSLSQIKGDAGTVLVGAWNKQTMKKYQKAFPDWEFKTIFRGLLYVERRA